MYRLLEVLQKKSNNAILFGRDDQAGFRLDTTFTHKQHGTIGVKNSTTTHTDFVNKQSTLLQGITSYLRQISMGREHSSLSKGVTNISFIENVKYHL